MGTAFLRDKKKSSPMSVRVGVVRRLGHPDTAVQYRKRSTKCIGFDQFTVTVVLQLFSQYAVR